MAQKFSFTLKSALRSGSAYERCSAEEKTGLLGAAPPKPPLLRHLQSAVRPIATGGQARGEAMAKLPTRRPLFWILILLSFVVLGLATAGVVRHFVDDTPTPGPSGPPPPPSDFAVMKHALKTGRRRSKPPPPPVLVESGSG